jgi:hypothetical protein
MLEGRGDDVDDGDRGDDNDMKIKAMMLKITIDFLAEFVVGMFHVV